MPRRYSIIAGVASYKHDGPFLLHREVEASMRKREAKINALKRKMLEHDLERQAEIKTLKKQLGKSSKGVVRISITSTSGKSYDIVLDGTMTINGLPL
jgi:hypothetical protein